MGSLGALFAVEVQRGRWISSVEAAAAEDLLLHLLQALLHLHVDHGGHQPLGNLLRRDAHDRAGHVGIGPQERHHHRDHQAREHRPDQPGAVAAQHVDIVFDVGRTPGNGHEILWCCHNTGPYDLLIEEFRLLHDDDVAGLQVNVLFQVLAR